MKIIRNFNNFISPPPTWNFAMKEKEKFSSAFNKLYFMEHFFVSFEAFAIDFKDMQVWPS